MSLYFPAFIQAVRNSKLAPHLDDFTQGFRSGFESRVFLFSSFVASFFFDPATPEHNLLFQTTSEIFEQRILVELQDITLVSVQDVTSNCMPAWAGPDVRSFAEHFSRSSTYAPFVVSLQHRFFTNPTVQRLMGLSIRGPGSANELRNIMYAFASVALLVKALNQTALNFPVNPEHTPMLAMYMQRVVERFHTEAKAEYDYTIRFNGPVNPAAYFLDGIPLYSPLQSVSTDTHNDLCRVLVAAYRALTCSTASARDILAWTQFVLNSFYSLPCTVWATTAAAKAAPSSVTIVQPVVKAVVTTITTAPSPVQMYAAPTPKTPKTPQTPKAPCTPKNTLRFEAAVDNF